MGRVGWLALAATLQFLALNGWQADLDPPETATALLAELTQGTRSLSRAQRPT